MQLSTTAIIFDIISNSIFITIIIVNLVDDHFIIIDYYYGYGMLQCSAVQVLVENGIQIQRFQRVELLVAFE